MATEETQVGEFAALQVVPDRYPKMALSLDRVDLSEDGVVRRDLPDFQLEA